jgi:ribonuclease HI
MENQLDIYTDAGGKPESYGMGVLFIYPNEREQRFCFRTNLELLKNEFNVTEGIDNTTIIETYAIYKALQNVNKSYDKIVIYTDSLHTYDVFNKINRSWLKSSELYQNIVKETKKLMIDKNVEICWIKSHCGVYGNEIADQLSTRAKNVNRNMPFCNNPYNYLDKINLFDYEFNYSFEIDKIKLNTTIGEKYIV